MLLVCSQCGNQDYIMLKMPSNMITLATDKIIFDNSSEETYINLCKSCIGLYEK